MKKMTAYNEEDRSRTFQEPELKFVEPRLRKQGDATKITAGFFGEFSVGQQGDRGIT